MSYPIPLITLKGGPALHGSNCTEGVQWIWVVFQQCAISQREIAAVVFGLISALIWIAFAIPQIVENFLKGIPDQALSPVMLTCFFIGDTINLIGCLLTHQLPLQVISAAIGVLNDTIQISQFLYYKLKHRVFLQHFTAPTEISQAVNPWTESRISTSPAPVLAVVYVPLGFVLFAGSFWSFGAETDHASRAGSRCLFTTEFVEMLDDPHPEPLFPTRRLLLGYILGWISASIYISSRISQIIKNWQRASTKGLSPISFAFAIIGNVTYGLQIFLTSVEANFIIHSLPWLFGSLGVVILDVIICSQFLYYWNRRYIPLEQDVESGTTVSSG